MYTFWEWWLHTCVPLSKVINLRYFTSIVYKLCLNKVAIFQSLLYLWRVNLLGFCSFCLPDISDLIFWYFHLILLSHIITGFLLDVILMNSHMYCFVPLWPKLDTWPKLASMTFCPWHFNIESCDPRTKKQLELFYPASDQPLQDSPCPSLLLGLRLLSLFLHGPSLLQWNCLPLCVTGCQWPVLGGCSRLLGTKNHSVVLSNSWVAQRSQRVGHDWGTTWQHAAPMSGWGALWCSLRPISLGLSNRSSYSVFLLPFWMQLMNADPLGNFLVVQWLGGLSWCGSTVKNLPVVQETQETRIQSLGWEDPLEKGMATCSSILAWKIPRTEEPGGLHSMGSQRVRHD